MKVVQQLSSPRAFDRPLRLIGKAHRANGDVNGYTGCGLHFGASGAVYDAAERYQDAALCHHVGCFSRAAPPQ